MVCYCLKTFQASYSVRSHFQQVENGAFNWAMMPAELRPNWKRKLHHKNSSKKIPKDVNVEETLKVLEQKEKLKKTDGTAADDDDKESENVCCILKITLKILHYEIFTEKISQFLISISLK